MASKKSGIPVKSGSRRRALKNDFPLLQTRPSSIPIKKAKAFQNDAKLARGPNEASNSGRRENDFQEEIERLQNEVKKKDSAINDLNDKLMERMTECQVLREENEVARESLHLSTDLEVSGKVKDVENLVRENESFIESMLEEKHELERKFEVELDILKSQHEVELISLEQRLEELHQEKIAELQTSISKEKEVSDQLKQQISMIHNENENTRPEDLKLRYEKEIADFKQQVQLLNSEKQDLVRREQDIMKEMDGNKEKYQDDVETLKYVLQEKDVLLNDLKSKLDTGNLPSQGGVVYTEDDVTSKLDALRRELTTEHEHNLELANELWRKKLDENMSGQQGGEGKENVDKLLDDISDLKEQLHEAEELQELLDIQEKELEELRDSHKDYEERYNTLYKEVEGKWQHEFSESEIVDKIKRHYEAEIERLHGELEDIQTENSNLKTELNLMVNDFGGGHSRVNSPVRRTSVTARLDMKAEIEDYKVQLATLERDLEHALNQNERLKLEKGVENVDSVDSHREGVHIVCNNAEENRIEKDTWIAEKDQFRAKLEESGKEKMTLEKQLKVREEENIKHIKELHEKNIEIGLLKKEYETCIQNSDAKVLEMKEKINEITAKCEIAEDELESVKQALTNSKEREHNLKETLQELKDNRSTLIREFEEAKAKIVTLEDGLSKSNLIRDKAEDELLKIKDAEERQAAKTRKRVTELENMLAQGKVANEALHVKYDKLLSENDMKTQRILELTELSSEVKKEFENSQVQQYEKGLSECDLIFDEVKLSQNSNELDLVSMKESLVEIESKLQNKDMEHKALNVKYNELLDQSKNWETKIKDLESGLNYQKTSCSEIESLKNNLKTENAILQGKISETENHLQHSMEECAQLKRKIDNLSVERGKMKSTHDDFEASLEKRNIEFQDLKEKYESLLQQSNINIGKLDQECAQLRKQIIAFEKKVTTLEREKKGLEETVSLLGKTIEDHKKEISSLNEKCESYDWKNTELERKLKAAKNFEDRLKKYTEKNQELLGLIEKASQEKNDSLAKQAQLTKEIKRLKSERDVLTTEKEAYDKEKEHDNSENERKLGNVEKKLKEKDRVLNEMKKHCRELKENEIELRKRISEKEERCLELQERVQELDNKLTHLANQKDLSEKKTQEQEGLETDRRLVHLQEKVASTNRENAKLKQQLEERMKVYDENEKALKDELMKQSNEFACKLKNACDNLKQSAQNEITRLRQESDEAEGIRKEMARLSHENHALKIKLDNTAIEVSKEKEEKYKAEKLKDEFRFEVQNLQERLNDEQEKLSVLEGERLRGEIMISEEKSKLLTTLSEYETKNTMLLADVDKASSTLRTTKEKYARLKEKFTTLAKKYKKLNEHKLNKSDVQVGPDSSVDLNLVVEDLQRSKEIAEEANVKLRMELDKLREDIGRNEYQMKAVRKANVVLMKQSRCLYFESEEQKRIDEEKTQELQKYREMRETLQQKTEKWQAGEEFLKRKLDKITEDAEKLKRDNNEYFLAKNKMEIELGNKASECVLHSRQLEKLKHENDFLYHQVRKLQAELEVTRAKSFIASDKSDQNQNLLQSFNTDVTSSGHTSTDMESTEKSGTRSTFSEYNFDEVRRFIPPVFNNEKVVGDTVIESPNQNTVIRNPSNKKDTNLRLSRNIINNDFAEQKYLGKTYWQTVEFLKKK